VYLQDPAWTTGQAQLAKPLPSAVSRGLIGSYGFGGGNQKSSLKRDAITNKKKTFCGVVLDMRK